MKWIRQALVLLFLVIWLPATNHCYLETAGIIPTDECCSEPGSTSSSSDPCDSGCKIIEKAVYKTETAPKIHAAAPLLLSFLQPSLKDRPNTACTEIQAWPPATLHLPQFVISTSLPVRAPSFVS